MHLRNVLPVALVAMVLFAIPALGVDWTPAEMNALVWLDGTDTNTLWADTNGTVQATNSVARWDDKSGNSNHMLQATSGQRPATGSRTINGLNALDFDGIDDKMKESSNAFGSVISNAAIFAVLKSDQRRYTGIIMLDSSLGFYEYTTLAFDANGTREWPVNNWTQWYSAGMDTLTNQALLHSMYYSVSECNNCQILRDVHT